MHCNIWKMLITLPHLGWIWSTYLRFLAFFQQKMLLQIASTAEVISIKFVYTILPFFLRLSVKCGNAVGATPPFSRDK